jgi:hypothetical protein
MTEEAKPQPAIEVKVDKSILRRGGEWPAAEVVFTRLSSRSQHRNMKKTNTPGINCRVTPELRRQVEDLAAERGWP